MSQPPEYTPDPSQQPYGQQPPQQPQSGGYPGGQYYQQPPQQPGAYAPPVERNPGFFAALFDFSFREFITSRIIRIVYVLWLVLIAFGFLAGLVSSIALMGDEDFGVLGFFLLIGTFIGTAVWVLVSRITLELLIVVFRISEDLSALRKRGGL
ncbi:DUF4282 domain-containing protein [Nocardiopsis eucommiae]|uniref:DUF4282 domain-containing protein n=1 Tax=Nocardiopsis eucommiae TaxID=2831970 RepID=A0A975L7B3_9ACTN|nr:DUF4282 domain-containing protein [Nocardiopsis eucommiae]